MTKRLMTHFENNEANTSQSILLELMTILGRYRQSLYLVGGWAPFYLLKNFQKPANPFQHVGSIDIDLVIDFKKVSEAEYATIVDLLNDRGYHARKDRLERAIPFSFERMVKGLSVAVDFLAPEYGGTSKSHRHQEVQDDFLARKARGADLLPNHHFLMTLDGYLPKGGHNQCELRVGNIVSILSMKGITISERYKEKDAYDLYALIAHYKEGANSCYKEVAPFLENGLVKEAMRAICDKFSLQDSPGPVWAAKFMEPDNATASRLKQTEIYRQVLPFVEKIREDLA